MCELLGMNCNVPTDIVFSFAGFRQRGGRTGPHRDGWGIAFYEGKGARVFHDPRPSFESEIARVVESHPIKSLNVISHIRRLTRARICVENTHPFQRELWGQTWVFAHNGYLTGIKRRRLEFYRPIGTTDSEHAFCYMLDRIRRRFPRPPAPRTLWRTIADLAADVAQHGKFNFLMCDSRHLYAHCTTRLCWIQRRAPFSRATLIDADVEIDFSEHTTPRDKVVVVATQPLTRDETWITCQRGELTVFADGELQEVRTGTARTRLPVSRRRPRAARAARAGSRGGRQARPRTRRAG